MEADVIVIGGGVVGSAIAYGLVQRRQRVIVLDGDDRDYRAARANFGLVWVQGKGSNLPAYSHWSRKSSQLWGVLSQNLLETTGIDVHFEQNGGLVFCNSAGEFDARLCSLQALQNRRDDQPGGWEMIDRLQLERLMPAVSFGPQVCGASFGCWDGHADPMRLLSALQGGISRLGGNIESAAPAQKILSTAAGFRVETDAAVYIAARVVIAAGLGSQVLGAQVGLDVALRPQRGQILVTERLEPLLPLPASGLRQTREGTVMIGATHEDVDLDVATTCEAAAALSARALGVIPSLSCATVVRQWAGLRVLTPDGNPIYAQSTSHPGAFMALCHSGITLAAVHCEVLAQAIVDGALPSSLDAFHPRRFDVPKAA